VDKVDFNKNGLLVRGVLLNSVGFDLPLFHSHVDFANLCCFIM
jgi:hypothetical protein